MNHRSRRCKAEIRDQDQKPIIATASDAIISKLSSASKGYYDDPFLSHLATDAAGLTNSSFGRSHTQSKFRATESLCKLETNLIKNQNQVDNTSFRAGDEHKDESSGSVPIAQQNRITRSSLSLSVAANTIYEDDNDDDDDDDDDDDIEQEYFDNDNDYENYDIYHDDAPVMDRVGPMPPLNQFQREPAQHHPPRRPFSVGSHHAPPSPLELQQQPIIRKGTHARVAAIDHAISTFLSLHLNDATITDNKHKVQVVVLGSGRDTTYLRSQVGLLPAVKQIPDCRHDDNYMDDPTDHAKKIELGQDLFRWYEIDHPSVIQTKCDLLNQCPMLDLDCQKLVPSLPSNIGTTDDDSNNISFMITPKSVTLPSVYISPRSATAEPNRKSNCSPSTIDSGITELPFNYSNPPYHLIGFDLRQSFSSLLSKLCQYHSFSLEAPTLFVLECVQMYLPESVSRQIITSINKSCHRPFLVLYDPILLNDPFGKVMEHNLKKAGISDPSLSIFKTRTLQHQIDKLIQCGFSQATGCDMMAAYETILTDDERKRANRCEMLDEMEEWILIMRHYCFIVAAATSTLACTSTDSHREMNTTIITDVGHTHDLQDDSTSRNREISEKFCSTDVENLLGFVKSRCLSQRSSEL